MLPFLEKKKSITEDESTLHAIIRQRADKLNFTNDPTTRTWGPRLLKIYETENSSILCTRPKYKVIIFQSQRYQQKRSAYTY